MKYFYKKNIKYSPIFFILIPFITFAFNWQSSTFSSVIDEVISVISLAIPLLFALSFLVFFWGVSRFILNSGSTAEIQKGKSYMIWGVVALFILISIRAIIGIVARDLEIGDSSSIPLIPTSTNSGGSSSEDFSLPSGIPNQ